MSRSHASSTRPRRPPRRRFTSGRFPRWLRGCTRAWSASKRPAQNARRRRSSCTRCRTRRSRAVAKAPARKTVRVPEVAQTSTATGTAPATRATVPAPRSAAQSILNQRGRQDSTNRTPTTSAAISSRRSTTRTAHPSGFRSAGPGTIRTRMRIRLLRVHRCSFSFRRRSSARASLKRFSTLPRIRRRTARLDSTIAARTSRRRRQPARNPTRRSKSSFGGTGRLKR